MCHPACSVLTSLPLTYDGRSVGSAGQQVVHDKQEDRVAQNQSHLERGPVHAVRREVEGQDVNEHEEGAGDQQVDHVEDRPPLYDHLGNKVSPLLHANKSGSSLSDPTHSDPGVVTSNTSVVSFTQKVMMSHSSIPNWRMDVSPRMSTSSHSPLVARYRLEFLDISSNVRAGLTRTSLTSETNSQKRRTQKYFPPFFPLRTHWCSQTRKEQGKYLMRVTRIQYNFKGVWKLFPTTVSVPVERAGLMLPLQILLL